MTFHRAVVLANPIAGRGRGIEIGRRVVAGLARRGLAAELQLSRGATHEPFRAPPATDLVVVVGGDGTIREALSTLPDRAIAVGLVPAGTANVLAGDLGMPRDVERALDVIAAGRTMPLDVASANGRLCFVAASTGFDAAVVHEVERRRRGPISKLSYVPAALAALRTYACPQLSVEIDGRALPEAFGLVIVGNAIGYGGVFRLCPHRRLDDGLFEVYLVRRGHVVGLAALAARGLTRGLCGRARCHVAQVSAPRSRRLLGPGCELRRAYHVRVTSPLPVPCQVDGDAAGHSPLDITVEPARHLLVVP